jgi:Na+-driven multidrug efflux pump
LGAGSEHSVSNKQRAGVLKKILEVALPVSLESIFQMSFNVVDQIIVGLLGASAVAAVGMSNNVAAIAILLCAAIGTHKSIIRVHFLGGPTMCQKSSVTLIGGV